MTESVDNVWTGLQKTVVVAIVGGYSTKGGDREHLGKRISDRGHTCLSNVIITQQSSASENSEGP